MRAHFDDRFGIGRRIVSRHFAERTFVFPHIGQDRSFDDDFGRRRDFQIDGFRFDHFDGLSS